MSEEKKLMEEAKIKEIKWSYEDVIKKLLIPRFRYISTDSSETIPLPEDIANVLLEAGAKADKLNEKELPGSSKFTVKQISDHCENDD
jgi:hypothetical protein